jgi:sporulation protein YlmC with PRC-barrel domain
MSISISELYGKKIISNEGAILGEVKGVMLNIEEGAVSHLLLNDPDVLMRSTDPRNDLRKNSVAYKRVKKVSETVIVGKE